MPATISAFDIDLPTEVEAEVLAFMKDGVGMSGQFTARMLREGLMDEMKRRGMPVAEFPENWSRRVIDAVLKREREAGRVDIFGARKGPNVNWRWVRED